VTILEFFVLASTSALRLLKAILLLAMVIKTMSQLYVGAVLSIGGAPYLQALVPMGRSYVMLTMKTGSTAIVKEYMTLTMRLVLQYFASDKVNLATSASNAAFEILQRAVRRQIEHKFRSKKIQPVVAECIMLGLEEVMRSEGLEKRRLKTVLDAASRLFADTMDRNQIQPAKDLSRGWLLLLITAIDPPNRNGKPSPTLTYLLQTWAAILQREARADSRSIERLLEEIAEDILDASKQDQTLCNTIVRVWIYLLHTAVKESQNEAATLISTVLVQGLQKAVGNGHREAIRKALLECAISLDQDIKEDDVQGITARSKSIELLRTAARNKAREVDSLLLEGFDRKSHETEYGSEGGQRPPVECEANSPVARQEPLSPVSTQSNTHPHEIYRKDILSARDSSVSPLRDNEATQAWELPNGNPLHELPNGNPLHELPNSNPAHELPDNYPVHKLPHSGTVHELPGSPH
jgi:hypothetical protein